MATIKCDPAQLAIRDRQANTIWRIIVRATSEGAVRTALSSLAKLEIRESRSVTEGKLMEGSVPAKPREPLGNNYYLPYLSVRFNLSRDTRQVGWMPQETAKSLSQ